MPGTPDGAEDQVYTSQTPPYRTGNWPMMSPSELMNLPGFGADRYRKIAPYVTALPTATAHDQYLHGAGRGAREPGRQFERRVLRSGGAGQRPQDRLFSRYEHASGISSDPTARRPSTSRFGTTSQYFRLTTRVTLGTTEFTLYSLLLRGNGGKVTPLLRSFGTP